MAELAYRYRLFGLAVACELPLPELVADAGDEPADVQVRIGPIDAPVLHTPSVVNMGNPHAIFWVSDAASYDLTRLGPIIENDPVFPQRANISLVGFSNPSMSLR